MTKSTTSQSVCDSRKDKLLNKSFGRAQSIWEVREMMDYGNNTKFVKAHGIIGRDTKVPVPSSLQRHVYHICGVGDFLNKEKAIQVRIILNERLWI